MKHFIQTAALCLCLLTTLGFAGCSARTAVTEEAFTSAMEELGYTEQELDTDSLAKAAEDGVASCRIFATASSGTAVHYLFTDSSAARAAYANLISINSTNGEETKKTKEVDSATYNRVEYDLAGTKLVLVRAENMLLSVKAPTEETKAILDQLGL